MSSNAEQETAARDDHRPTSRRRGFFRPIFHRWFFSTDRRYQMFQTIVGGTIANLLAAGIITAIAVTSGNLRITFSWSWHFFREALLVAGVIGLIGGVVATAGWYSEDRKDGTKPGWLAVAGQYLYLAIGSALLWDLIFTFFDAFSFSIVHHTHK